MARECGAETDLGRLLVANLAHHDDVGILPQESAQGRRERQPDLSLDLHLVHSLELVLDRVFDRADIDLGLVELVEARIERRRLAAAGGSGHQCQAVGRLDRLDAGPSTAVRRGRAR